jgi:hypothetical protein
MYVVMSYSCHWSKLVCTLPTFPLVIALRGVLSLASDWRRLHHVPHITAANQSQLSSIAVCDISRTHTQPNRPPMPGRYDYHQSPPPAHVCAMSVRPG